MIDKKFKNIGNFTKNIFFLFDLIIEYAYILLLIKITITQNAVKIGEIKKCSR
jgi:hypothetical protein